MLMKQDDICVLDGSQMGRGQHREVSSSSANDQRILYVI